MKIQPRFPLRWASPVLAAAIILTPAISQACATCFGASDTKLAQGLNMGIFALLGCITLVMVWIGGFFLYLSRRAATEASLAETDNAEMNSSTPAQL